MQKHTPNINRNKINQYCFYYYLKHEGMLFPVYIFYYNLYPLKFSAQEYIVVTRLPLTEVVSEQEQPFPIV